MRPGMLEPSVSWRIEARCDLSRSRAAGTIFLGAGSYWLVHITPSRTSIHFLQESVRIHFQDLGRQCIILAGILEDLGRKCLVLQDLARNV